KNTNKIKNLYLLRLFSSSSQEPPPMARVLVSSPSSFFGSPLIKPSSSLRHSGRGGGTAQFLPYRSNNNKLFTTSTT
ncbi:unnamed protein product, partial [Arabidopsis halleri]